MSGTVAQAADSPDAPYQSTVSLLPPGAETAKTSGTSGGVIFDRTEAYKSTVTSGGPGAATPLVAAADTQYIIHCDHSYHFSDVNGSFSIQRACGGSTAPWGYNIAYHWCSVMSSSVVERGMDWTRNGARQPRQAGHNVACDYQFRGTFNPVRANDRVLYSDDFTGYLDGGVKWELSIHGSLMFPDNPCSPTSC